MDGLPAFGVCFVDTATGEFNLTEFQDDVDMTKFETFVAQIRPQELILEKVSTVFQWIDHEPRRAKGPCSLASPFAPCASSRTTPALPPSGTISRQERSFGRRISLVAMSKRVRISRQSIKIILRPGQRRFGRQEIASLSCLHSGPCCSTFEWYA